MHPEIARSIVTERNNDLRREAAGLRMQAAAARRARRVRHIRPAAASVHR
ncbi:MAG: hypothetical protein ABJB47_02965 [Actinomycetota bacterium]